GALALAAKGQADLAISVVKNSVAQVAVFLFPLLVLVSLPFEHHLTFQLAPVSVGALLLTALAMWQITRQRRGDRVRRRRADRPLCDARRLRRAGLIRRSACTCRTRPASRR